MQPIFIEARGNATIAHVAKIPGHVAKILHKILAEYNPRYYLCSINNK